MNLQELIVALQLAKPAIEAATDVDVDELVSDLEQLDRHIEGLEAGLRKARKSLKGIQKLL